VLGAKRRADRRRLREGRRQAGAVRRLARRAAGDRRRQARRRSRVKALAAPATRASRSPSSSPTTRRWPATTTRSRRSRSCAGSSATSASILRNFVNFSDFYDGSKRDGVFLAGTLYLDGRAFSLTVPVSDAGKHGALAAMSSAYLAYCDCKRAGATRTIAAVLTNGDADNVFVGRNGIFYDRDGKDWDATVTKIIANPISVREAFWTPYKKLVRVIEDQVTKRASEAEAKSTPRSRAPAPRSRRSTRPRRPTRRPPRRRRASTSASSR
jgi:hypothetical protein